MKVAFQNAGLVIRVVFTALVGFVFISSTVHAQVVVSRVNVSDTLPNPNDTITVAINIDMSGMPAPDTSLGSFTADLDWNPNVLNLVSHSGILQGYTGVVNTANADSGNIRFNGAKATGTTGSFDVLIITFETVGLAGQSTNLQLQYSAMAAAYSFTNLLPFLSVIDGFVTVAGLANNPPVLDSIPDQSVDIGSLLETPIHAIDPDGDTITLAVNNLPSFAAFVDSGNGAGSIQFAPQSGDAGVYPNIEVIATDSGSPPLSDTTSFTLTVTDTATTPVIINELDSDTPGTDTMEFIELFDGGTGNTPLDGLVVVFYNGSNDLSYLALDLDGFSTNAEGYFVLGNAAVPNVGLVFPNNTLQNGPDAVALYMDDASNFPNGTPVTTVNLVDAIVYDTDDPDDPELLVLLNPGEPQVNENGAGDKDNHSNQRIPNGSGGPRNTSTYVQAPPTPGTENRAPVNTPPVLDSIPDQSMTEGSVLDVGIVATDSEGDSITLSVNNLPTFASFVDSGNGIGTITFSPGFGDAGAYPGIEVIATDNGAPNLSDTTVFSLTVLDSNRAPVAVDDSVTTPEDTSIVIFVLANDTDPDNDPLTVTGVIQPGNGSAVIDGGDTSVTYTPAPNFFGEDSFDYVISDGTASDTGRVHITVLPVNDPPTITGLPDTVLFDANSSVALDIWEAVDDVETPDSLLIYGFSAVPDTLILIFNALTGMLEISAQDTLHGVNADLFITVQDPQGAAASDTIHVVVSPVVSIDDPFINQIPHEYVLFQNYPNPFNPTTTIRFGIPQAGRIRLEVFDLLGQRLAILLDEHRPAGYHTIAFNGANFSSGIYFYRIQANHYIKVRKMLLTK